MLYWLLVPLRDQFFFFNVFRYITVRTALAGLTALVLSFLLGPWLIGLLRRRQIGQEIREDARPVTAAETGLEIRADAHPVTEMPDAHLILTPGRLKKCWQIRQQLPEQKILCEIVPEILTICLRPGSRN